MYQINIAHTTERKAADNNNNNNNNNNNSFKKNYGIIIAYNNYKLYKSTSVAKHMHHKFRIHPFIENLRGRAPRELVFSAAFYTSQTGTCRGLESEK